MATTLLATCGLRAGGQGGWDQVPDDSCKLILTSSGLVDALDGIRPIMTGAWKVGLFQNDRQPRLDDDVGDYTPCNFSGYNGLRLVYAMSPAAMFGERARTTGTPITWVHNGGPVANSVWGLYVVNLAGAVVLAERFCDGPFNLDRAGRNISLTPLLDALNEREVL